MRNVRDEIAAHDFKTTLLAHVGNENRETVVGYLSDAHMQVQGVGGQGLAGFQPFAVRILRGGAGGAVERNRQLTFAHHAVRGNQLQNVTDLGKRHRTVFDQAETLRTRRNVLHRSERVGDDQRLRHDGNQLALRLLYGHARAEQRRVLRSPERAWIVRRRAIFESPAEAVCDRRNGRDHHNRRNGEEHPLP